MKWRYLIVLVLIFSYEYSAAQSDSDEYVILAVDPECFTKHIEKGKSIRPKNIRLIRVDDIVIINSESLKRSHKGTIDAIGPDFIILDDIRYDASDLNNIITNNGSFSGASIISVILKINSVFIFTSAVGLLVSGEPSGALLSGGIGFGLWKLSEFIKPLGFKNTYTPYEGQFSFRKLVPEPNSLP